MEYKKTIRKYIKEAIDDLLPGELTHSQLY